MGGSRVGEQFDAPESDEAIAGGASLSADDEGGATPSERDQQRDNDRADDLDPGAYIGHAPERESETIPGGVGKRDERTSAYDSQPGVPGEPD